MITDQTTWTAVTHGGFVGQNQDPAHHSADGTKFLLFGECPHGTVIARRSRNSPIHSDYIWLAVFVCWVVAITITNKRTADSRSTRGEMSLQKGVFTSDDLLQLMLNLLAQVPWGANKKDVFRWVIFHLFLPNSRQSKLKDVKPSVLLNTGFGKVCLRDYQKSIVDEREEQNFSNSSFHSRGFLFIYAQGS